MKQTLLFFTIALTAISISAQSANSTPTSSTKNVFAGEISDSQCATNVHSKTQSHKEMTADHTMGNTKADCVRTCVRKMGGTYVLLSPDGKVYRLSDQDTPDKFASEKVKVYGTADKSGMITVDKIEKAS